MLLDRKSKINFGVNLWCYPNIKWPNVSVCLSVCGTCWLLYVALWWPYIHHTGLHAANHRSSSHSSCLSSSHHITRLDEHLASSPSHFLLLAGWLGRYNCQYRHSTGRRRRAVWSVVSASLSITVRQRRALPKLLWGRLVLTAAQCSAYHA